MVKCAICGKNIKNIYHIQGKIYGYNCYQKELALLYKKYEDEKNAEYSAKCFAAMQVFKNKKSNTFHDSVCKQYDECRMLTAKQLDCVVKSFTKNELLEFYILHFSFTKKDSTKRDIAYSVYNIIKDKHYNNICDEHIVDREDITSILLYVDDFKRGLFFYKDYIINKIFMQKAGINDFYLKEYQEDEEVEILKTVYPSKNN